MLLLWSSLAPPDARQASVIRQPRIASFQLSYAPRPASWLAIRSQNPQAVRDALGLDHFTPCPWVEGLTGGHGFFIGAPVNGWIIVTGSGLPDPGAMRTNVSVF